MRITNVECALHDHARLLFQHQPYGQSSLILVTLKWDKLLRAWAPGRAALTAVSRLDQMLLTGQGYSLHDAG